jgi:hypothetical protein
MTIPRERIMLSSGEAEAPGRLTPRRGVAIAIVALGLGAQAQPVQA